MSDDEKEKDMVGKTVSMVSIDRYSASVTIRFTDGTEYYISANCWDSAEQGSIDINKTT